VGRCVGGCAGVRRLSWNVGGGVRISRGWRGRGGWECGGAESARGMGGGSGASVRIPYHGMGEGARGRIGFCEVIGWLGDGLNWNRGRGERERGRGRWVGVGCWCRGTRVPQQPLRGSLLEGDGLSRGGRRGGRPAGVWGRVRGSRRGGLRSCDSPRSTLAQQPRRWSGLRFCPLHASTGVWPGWAGNAGLRARQTCLAHALSRALPR